MEFQSCKTIRMHKRLAAVLAAALLSACDSTEPSHMAIGIWDKVRRPGRRRSRRTARVVSE